MNAKLQGKALDDYFLYTLTEKVYASIFSICCSRLILPSLLDLGRCRLAALGIVCSSSKSAFELTAYVLASFWLPTAVSKPRILPLPSITGDPLCP